MVTDPISDMLTRIRNAILAGQDKVSLPASKMLTRIAEILRETGYINDFRLVKDSKQGVLKLYLKTFGPRQSAIAGLRRVSKPGRRVYVGTTEIPRVLRGMGIAIISTPRGIMSGQEARRQEVGGEVLCYVW